MKQTFMNKWIAAAALLLCQLPASAHDMHKPAAEAGCTDVALSCATKVTPAFGPDGKLWIAMLAGGKVAVANSTDGGRNFTKPVAVTDQKLDMDWGPDARPKIVIDKHGDLIVAFSTFRDTAFNGEVFTTRSTDGGATFAPIRPITSNNVSQRFETLALDTDGTVFAAWLDKRNRAPAKKKGEAYDGAGLFFATSRNGVAYSQAQLVHNNTCECCRLGVAFAGHGRPVVIFRNIFEDGVRDHAITTFSDLDTPGPIHRVSNDDWKISACPHQGPSLSIAPTGTYHATWYTNGKNRQGLFYARSLDGGATFSKPVPIGDPAHNPSRAFVLATAQGTYLAWKEFDGEKTAVRMMQSADDGKTWSEPKTVMETADSSDHPLLVSFGRAVFLSWMTKKDGYRFQPVGQGT
ncbi:sialidase family protein [Afipia felis]|uniref:Neuraminidase (Sialidase) n=2 Tax=Afipia felis TaxID=1035 RepID=A0A380W788_AFIFE|nr:sialidase family protein [Afipia felis]EKS28042.1 hypothetical protein HMPREF9697_00570 [Afipia felis ATCC 53690]SUU76752.1 Neuraminidase (sialidase) [Afipia felis]SUU84818.1 Neuraminidase (sialidase) [Afipia felis]